MGKLGAFLDTLNLLSGVSARHNRALRDANDCAGTIQKFLTTYDLYGSSNFGLLLENVGKAKFDLTAIAYRARLLIKTVKNIKGQQVSPLISEIVTSVENLRRALIDPSLYGENLSEVILSFRISFEKLQDALSDIEYL